MEPITLISPDGREFVATDEVQYNDLVIGRGYTPKSAQQKATPPATRQRKDTSQQSAEQSADGSAS